MAPDDTKLHMMNRALDQELSEQELAELSTRLDESPTDTKQWNLLHKTDELLRTTPMIGPASGFTQRVLAAIAAVPMPQFARRNPGLGIALGLAIAAVLTIPVLSALLFVILSVITDPGALNGLFQTLLNTASYVMELGANVGDELQAFVTGTPMLPLLVTAVVPVTIVWVWLLWALLGNPRILNRR